MPLFYTTPSQPPRYYREKHMNLKTWTIVRDWLKPPSHPKCLLVFEGQLK
jgi:hypothetical protein